jgi:hypothetical protein
LRSLAVVFTTLIVCLTFSFKCSAQTHDNKKSKLQAIQLKQTHYFFGNLNVIASKHGLRLESLGSWKFFLVAKAPDWNVTVFRNDDKIYYTSTLKKFLEGGLVSQMLVTRKPLNFPGSPGSSKLVIAGVHSICLSTRWALCEYLPAQSLVAPEVESILYESLRMPTCGGICLRFVQSKEGKDWLTGLDERGSQQIGIATQSAAQISVTNSVFDAPTGYKLAKSQREVLISKESRDSSDDAKDLFEMKK